MASFATTPLRAQSQNVALDHWAYRFIERLEVRGLYMTEDFSTRPYTREAFAGIILQISKKVHDDPALFSAVERALFEQLKGEFHEDIRRLADDVEINPDEYERNIFKWRNDEFAVRFDGLLAQQTRFETKRDVDPGIPQATTSWGLGFRVDIKQSMAIYAEGRSFILTGTDSLLNTVFNPSLGPPVTRKALFDVMTTDNATGYAVFRLPWFDFEAGRDLVEWGPGFRGNLVLSRNSNYYDLFKMTFRYEKFKFEYVHGFLNSDSTKYLVAHRMEIRPHRNFQFAFNESVIYGNRNVEFLYLNPFVPYIIAERHLGNQDNNTVSFDFTVFLYKYNFKFYGEILFDDFSFAKNIFGSWVNKWGVLVGGYWVDPFGLPDTDFRFELVRIQPFVYSHRRPINTFSNYANNMGHWLGPDSDDWYLEVRHRLHKNLRLGLSFEQRRRGQNDITNGARPPDGRFRFLDGVVERNRFVGLLLEWQAFRDVFLNATYHFVQSRNLRRLAGVSQSNHRLLLNVSVNY